MTPLFRFGLAASAVRVRFISCSLAAKMPRLPPAQAATIVSFSPHFTHPNTTAAMHFCPTDMARPMTARFWRFGLRFQRRRRLDDATRPFSDFLHRALPNISYHDATKCPAISRQDRRLKYDISPPSTWLAHAAHAVAVATGAMPRHHRILPCAPRARCWAAADGEGCIPPMH